MNDAFLFGALFLMAMLVSLYLIGQYDAPHRSIYDIGFGFGPAMQGLVEQHRLGYPDPEFGWWAYAYRMPMIPVLGALTSFISKRFAVFYAIKNVVFWAMWIYALMRLRARFHIAGKWVVLVATLVILLPYNAKLNSQIEIEEAYLVGLLGLAFALLVTAERTWDYVCLGLLVGSIYLTKSSMPLVCGVMVAWAAINGWRRFRFFALIPALGLAVAAFGWGAYIYRTTGVFAMGVHESSMNGLNFVKSNNAHALELYPRTSLDLLDLPALGMYPKRDSEWELSKAQMAMGRSFDRDHPDMVLKFDMKKLWVVCCDILESPQSVPGETRPLVVLSNIVNHSLVYVCLIWMVVRLWKRRPSRAELLFSLLSVAYLVPYLGGFIYMRHMVPLYSLAAMVLAIQLASMKDSPSRLDAGSSLTL